MYKIRVKNFICFLVTITMIVTVTSVVVYLRAKSEVINSVVSNLRTEFNNQQNEINDVFTKIKRAGDYLNYSRYIYELIMDDTSDEIAYNRNIDYLKGEYQNAYNILLSEENALIYTNVLFLDKDLPIAKKMVAQTLQADTRSDIFTNQFISTEKWYNDVLHADNDVLFFREPTDKNILLIAHIFRSQFDVDRVLGVSVVKINLRNMALRLSKIVEHSTVMVTDDEPVFANISMENVTGGDVTRITKDNEDYFMSFVWVFNNVGLVSLIAEKTVLHNVYQLKKFILVFCTAILLVGIALSFWTSGFLTRHILKLVRIMERADVLHGSEIDTSVLSKDEIGALYKAFRNMMERIKKLVIEKQELAQKEKETEIKALQAQINPHFICNVLNSVSMKALSKDEDEISRVMKLLAQMLRYNIKNMSKLAPITDEIEFIKNYLDIQRAVYGQALKMELDFKKDIIEWRIMRCVIQPLIENSILHGIENSEYSMNIKISSFAKDNNLYVVVEDDGVGCNASEMNEALQRDIPIRNNCIGCINVNRRIILRFGPEYGLHYEPIPKGTKAVLVFPQIKED